MERLKQIKAAASELKGVVIRGNNISIDDYTQAGFIAGAKWADEHPKSPWISVKERLPKEDVDVIIHTRFQGVFVGNFRGLSSDNHPIWEISNYNGYYYDIYDVDYWIFNPEPQKGGNDNE